MVADYSDEQALEFALVENLVREDLSKLEETEGILALMVLKLQLEREQVITLIRREGHNDALSRRTSSTTANIDWVIDILGRFGIDLQLFRTKHLPLLNLPENLSQAHLTGQLSYTKALELNRVKDDAARADLLTQALQNQWSLGEVKQQVRAWRSQAVPPVKGQGQVVLDRITAIRKQAQKAQPWKDVGQGSRLEKLLSEIEALLGNSY